MRAAVPLAALLLAATPARAGDTFHTTATSIVEWHGDNLDNIETNDDYADIINKLNVSFTNPTLQADLRLDTFTLIPAPGPGVDWEYPKPAPAGKKYKDDYRLERLTGILRPGSGLKITGGDFYAQFGNGIALALRKVDELGLETVLRGVRLDGKWKVFSMTLLGGVMNINNIDPQDQYFLEDPMDRLAGARAELKSPAGRFKLGMHGVWTRPEAGVAAGDDTWIAGGNVEAAIVPGKLQLGAEFDWGWFDHLYDQAHPQRDPGKRNTGFAAYLNLRAKMGPVSLLLEGKWYDTFALEGSPRYDTDAVPVFYNQPPTAERIDQEVENFHTVAGGRIKLDWRIIPSFTVFANVGGGDYVSLRDVIEKKAEDSSHVAQYLHTYAGLDLRWNMNRSSLVLSGGWRTEREPKVLLTHDATGWREKKRLVHWEGKLNLYVGGPWSLHVSALHEWRMKREFKDYRLQPIDYHWGTHIVGIDYGGVVSLSGAFEYDTDSATYDWYGWWQLKWFVRKNLILSILGGSQRGGLKCVGGVCKMVPAFAGLRTELVFRY